MSITKNKRMPSDEIYNLGNVSCKVSFDILNTGQVDAIGTLRILEVVRLLGLEKKIKIIKLQLLSFMAEFLKIK